MIRVKEDNSQVRPAVDAKDKNAATCFDEAIDESFTSMLDVEPEHRSPEDVVFLDQFVGWSRLAAQPIYRERVKDRSNTLDF